VVVLLLKTPIGGWALPLAGGLFVAGTLGGLLWGAFKRTPSPDAARLADRAWGLEDRVATALEWAGRPDHAAGRCAGDGRHRADRQAGAARRGPSRDPARRALCRSRSRSP
jgi:hypothetical protein